MSNYTINKNGVRVSSQGIPACCLNCHHYEYEWSEWGHETYRYCVKNIWFPTKKGTCKKQELIKTVHRYWPWWMEFGQRNEAAEEAAKE
jgi:hypothetical protein